TKIAGGFDGKYITYTALQNRANQLAHLLRSIGVKRNDLVALALPRSLEFLIGILGIQKAGGAYVPVDPNYPPERITYMIQNCEATVTITNADTLPFLPQASSLQNVVSFEEELPETEFKTYLGSDLDQQSTETPENVTTATDLAYMIYTSGSTGRPKGAMVRHDGAINHIYAEFDDLNFHEESAFLQSAPSSSDISVWQFLGPVVIGGRSIIVTPDTVSDPERLLKVIQEEKITIIELVPVVFRALLEHVEELPKVAGDLPYLEFAMITGEAAPVDLVNRWLERYPAIPMVNAYGPTEAADDVCQMILSEPLPADAFSVPIGKAIANMCVYVLDDDLNMVGDGEVGEIAVAGIGVGAGYYKRPDKTEAVFVDNPHASNAYEKTLYLTGDLGRYRPDGNLEFMERKDHQVKIRGYRIELGEIEAELRKQPNVRDAVVVAREMRGEKRLIGYVTHAGPVESSDLRVEIGKNLPDFMIPSLIMALDEFPLLPNGKINRKGLPMPDPTVNLSSEYVAPQTEMETTLVQIFQNVLKIDRVGMTDNFFEMGGHSLSAVRVLNKVRSEFGYDLPMADLFDYPSAALLIGRIETLQYLADGADAEMFEEEDEDEMEEFEF
ncbi:MAG: non-ribosomal peptide synthetase, partial [Chloroflexota bacterium]